MATGTSVHIFHSLLMEIVFEKKERQHAFFMTYKQFGGATTLMHAVVFVWTDIQARVKRSHGKKSQKSILEEAFGNFLVEWICSAAKDFSRNVQLASLAVNFAKTNLHKYKTRVQLAIIRANSGKLQLRSQLQGLDISSWTKIKPFKIARCLAYISHELFMDIDPSEILHSINTSNTPISMVNATKRFNKTVVWVQLSILNCTKVESRAKRLELLIKVAMNLKRMSDLSTLMAFVAAFNSAAISRLKSTFGLISPKVEDILEDILECMCPDKNWKKYRQVCDARPCIPYLALFIRDMMHMSEGTLNTIEEKLKRIDLQGKHILKFQHHQQTYIPPDNPSKIMLDYFRAEIADVEILSDRDLYQKSLNVEMVSTRYKRHGSAPILYQEPTPRGFSRPGSLQLEPAARGTLALTLRAQGSKPQCVSPVDIQEDPLLQTFDGGDCDKAKPKKREKKRRVKSKGQRAT